MRDVLEDIITPVNHLNLFVIMGRKQFDSLAQYPFIICPLIKGFFRVNYKSKMIVHIKFCTLISMLDWIAFLIKNNSLFNFKFCNFK